MKKFIAVAAFSLMTLIVFSQEPSHDHAQSSAGQSELNATTEAMGHGHDHEHMAGHMHMSDLRKPRPSRLWKKRVRRWKNIATIKLL
jgi:hypothetical protein